MLQSHLIAGTRAGPRVLITGGVHGDEWEPMAAVRRLMSILDPSELRGSVTLVPVVNEEAFRRGERTAGDGLDLARTCPGRADGSVTEQTAFALATLIQQADYYIDLHTGGTRYTVLPLAGYVLHPNAAVLAIQRRMARAFGLPIVWGTDWRLEGRSLSVARDANVPAIYCEYKGGGPCDPAGVDAYVAGCQNVLAELSLIDRAASSQLSPASLVDVYEDDRPGAGHMQVNHPVDRDGFFEPAVALGQHVRRGDLLGTVSDVLGRDVLPVHAAYDGLVLVLHTFARVTAHTSVAVLLDTSRKVV